MSGDLWGIRKLELGTWSERYANEIAFIKVSAVGAHHRKDFDKWQKKNVGNMVQLVPEPGNPYDKDNAIAVYAAIPKVQFGEVETGYDWVHVGYVMKESARAIRSRLKANGYDPNKVVSIGRIRTKPSRETTIELSGEIRVF